LIQINDTDDGRHRRWSGFRSGQEAAMPFGEILFLTLVVVAFGALAGALALVSWQDEQDHGGW